MKRKTKITTEKETEKETETEKEKEKEEKLTKKINLYLKFHNNTKEEIDNYFRKTLEKIDNLSSNLAQSLNKSQDEILMKIIDIKEDTIDKIRIYTPKIFIHFQNPENAQRFYEEYKDVLLLRFDYPLKDGIYIEFVGLSPYDERFLFSYQLLQKIYKSLIQMIEELPENPSEYLKKFSPEAFKLLVWIKMQK